MNHGFCITGFAPEGEVFYQYQVVVADTDGNGRIDFKEFRSLLKVLSPESRTQQAAEGFSMIDTNSDGQIDFDEFVEWWQQVWWEF